MGRIIALANQKGGVGKTTSAVNLSAWLSLLGHRVLLVDIDPQGNATSGVGIDKTEVNKCMYDLLIEGIDIHTIVLNCAVEGLDILPATMELAGAEIQMVNTPSREKVLKSSLDLIKDDYAYIIIDCPPSLGLLTVNALTAADTVLIPIQCEYYALEGLGQLMNTIKLIQQHLNPVLEIEGVLLTMFDGRTNLSIQVVDEVKKYFKHKVYRSIIPRNVRLSEAPSHGKPVMVYDRRSRGAELYMELAREVIEVG
ncbi:MAG: AAA family ATPase [Bacillota bacterium]|jgi:chromosome partitioning protein